jgi:hypothetical protein
MYTQCPFVFQLIVRNGLFRPVIGGMKEQAVDDLLHAAMLDDISKSFPERRTLLLLTGDGNDNGGRTSFPKVVEKALLNNWDVEVYAWARTTSHKYRLFEDAYPDQFSLNYLDDFKSLGLLGLGCDDGVHEYLEDADSRGASDRSSSSSSSSSNSSRSSSSSSSSSVSSSSSSSSGGSTTQSRGLKAVGMLSVIDLSAGDETPGTDVELEALRQEPHKEWSRCHENKPEGNVIDLSADGEESGDVNSKRTLHEDVKLDEFSENFTNSNDLVNGPRAEKRGHHNSEQQDSQKRSKYYRHYDYE